MNELTKNPINTEIDFTVYEKVLAKISTTVRMDTELYISWCGGYENVNLNTLKKYLQALKERNILNPRTGKPYAAGTFNKKMYSLKTFIRKCMELDFKLTAEEQYLVEQELKTIKKIKTKMKISGKNNYLDDTEKRILIDGLTPRIRAVAWLLAETGMRISEALRLRRSDLERDGEGYVINSLVGKGGNERETPIYILPECMDEINSVYGTDSEFLFPMLSDKTRHVSRTWFGNELRRQSVKLINKKVHPHSFRHSWATGSLQKGMRLDHVSAYLGHQSTTTTTKFYVDDVPSYEDIKRYAGLYVK